MAVAAIAAVGYGILTSSGDDARTDDLPPVAPPSTQAPQWLEEDLLVAPGTYDLEIVMDGVPDATFEVFGGGWESFSSGVYKHRHRFGGQHGAGSLQRHSHRQV